MVASDWISMNKTSLKRLLIIILVLLIFRALVKLLPNHDAVTEIVAERKAPEGIKVNSKPEEIHHAEPRPEITSTRPRTGLVAEGHTFHLDGHPFRILSGSFHYFRTQPAQWRDRLLKMKAAGLNTVTTYIPWNLHEKYRGEFSFGGRWDIVSFILHVQEADLKLILRPGPYICSEWDYGGLPSWLLSDPNMVIRSSKYKPFLDAVERYFAQLFPKLVPYQYTKGSGPIIAFQVENEFGSYSRDPEYLLWLKKIFIKYGLEELFFTSDGDSKLVNGTIPGVYATVNFMNNPDKAFRTLHYFQLNKPLMVAEYWAGWFDHWGERHHTTDPEEFRTTVYNIVGKHNASINFYMFTGGTNFEFWSGANNASVLQPTITSYDYDAPISESGNLNLKYFIVRQILQDLGLAEKPLPPAPKNNPTFAYGVVQMDALMVYNDLIRLVDNPINSTRPLMMEELGIHNGGGQGYGFLLYRAMLPPHAKELRINGRLFDIGLVFHNFLQREVYDWNSQKLTATLADYDVKSLLDIIVENSGRVNYRDHLNEQRKGIQGTVVVDGVPLSSWQHYPLEFDSDFMLKLQSATLWHKYMNCFGPCIFRAKFNVEEPMDTFLNMSAWQKGVVFINGFNIGRYWAWGPQRTLYVPAPLLFVGSNEIIIFEQFRSSSVVEFIDVPILGQS